MLSRIFIPLIASTFFLGSLAGASSAPAVKVQSSRALQQAKRVAGHENNQDLPSLAILLGSRVVKNAKKIAYREQQEQKAKNAKTRSTATTN